MPFRSFSILLVILTLAASVMDQDPADRQETQDENVQTRQNSSGSQATTTATQGEKTENPVEPEAHGTRLQWKDLPKNLWKDQKAIVNSPLHINRDNAKWSSRVGMRFRPDIPSKRGHSRESLLVNSRSIAFFQFWLMGWHRL